MSSSTPGAEVTRLIQAASAADRDAADRLLTILYDELRLIAQQRMSTERSDHTLQATALVHEAYVRLIGNTEIQWQNRAHFLGVAAEAMRRILVDAARQKKRLKRGGDRQRVELGDVESTASPDGDELLALDESLARLAEQRPEIAELVKLRHFAGMSLEESAEVLGVSRATASRHWEYARAWLIRDMQGRPAGEEI
ncbi:MAG: sigma-70 family RNA polymerase sigma factor [Phycisphaerales bacterium]|nr:sigma-70 family RNA polymerase sigma factor [Phycisphaerales bacterium]